MTDKHYSYQGNATLTAAFTRLKVLVVPAFDISSYLPSNHTLRAEVSSTWGMISDSRSTYRRCRRTSPWASELSTMTPSLLIIIPMITYSHVARLRSSRAGLRDISLACPCRHILKIACKSLLLRKLGISPASMTFPGFALNYGGICANK